MARGSYHHGNLRQALVEAAITLIDDKGPLAFPLADAARLAGVSVAAPYRHFSGRDELLSEVALQGFLAFTEHLTKAFDQGRPTPFAAMRNLGFAYLHFARARRGLYMAMFESGMVFPPESPTGKAAFAAFEVLHAAADRLFGHLPPTGRPPAKMVASHIWAMSHGVVELFTRGNTGYLPISAEDMLESCALIYLRGLGVTPDAAR